MFRIGSASMIGFLSRSEYMTFKNLKCIFVLVGAKNVELLELVTHTDTHTCQNLLLYRIPLHSSVQEVLLLGEILMEDD